MSYFLNNRKIIFLMFIISKNGMCSNSMKMIKTFLNTGLAIIEKRQHFNDIQTFKFLVRLKIIHYNYLKKIHLKSQKNYRTISCQYQTNYNIK